MTIGSITYVAIDGSTYTERMMFVSNPYAKDSDLEVNVHESGVVTAERAYFDGDGHPCIEFRSTGEKRRVSTEVDVNIKGHGEYKLNIFVDRFGTIFNTDALDFDGYIIIEIVILVGLGLIFITMLLSFLENLKKAKFSYSMIAYGGAALFCAAIITVLIYGMQWMNTFRGFLQDMLHTGELFALVSAPVMLVICLAMAFSNIWLLRHEGFRPQNMLGIALAFVWFLAIAAVFWCFTDFITFDYDISSYIGSCLSYIVIKRNNILLASCMHFLNNFASVSYSYLSNLTAARGGGVKISGDDISTMLDSGILNSSLRSYLMIGVGAPFLIVAGLCLLSPETHKKIRFIFAGILAGIMLTSSFAIFIHEETTTVLKKTYSYTVVLEGSETKRERIEIIYDGTYDINCTLLNSDGNYDMKIEDLNEEIVWQDSIPAGNVRTYSGKAHLDPGYYYFRIVNKENSLNDQPVFSVQIKTAQVKTE